MPRALEGPGQHALVFRAIARDAAADDLPFFGQKLTQTLHIFVINEGDFFAAKAAGLLSKETPSGAGAFTIPIAVPCTPRIISLGGGRSQNGTSSSGANSSFETSMGPCFF